jgi:transposase-like protein
LTIAIYIGFEEMMAERRGSVDHSTAHRWAIKLLPVPNKADNAIDCRLRVARYKAAVSALF